MKKKFTYSILLILFFSTSAFVVYRMNKKIHQPKFYYLKERTASLQSEEWMRSEKLWKQYTAITAQNPNDIKNRLALAMLYVQEARITGDHSYYDAAALKSVNEILDLEPQNFDALSLKSLIQLSQHHFADGIATAMQAQKINPYNTFVYGLLVDGNVESGNYKEAVAYSDKMISIRPDIRSYSRISYLREIHGDQQGAIDAMKMAVAAGIPGDETTEWSRVQLAKLYEETGMPGKAKELYELSFSFRPGYAYALAGLGRLAAAENNFDKAVNYFQQADSLVRDYSFKEELVKLYAICNRGQLSKSVLKEMIETMTKEANPGYDDASIGHYADRELAIAHLLAYNYDQALQHALAEYNRRPGNIDVNETLAWVYFKRKENSHAVTYINAALRTGCRNPQLLSHAGLIYHQSGNKQKAKQFLQEALQNNPVMDVELKNEAVTTLQSL